MAPVRPREALASKIAKFNALLTKHPEKNAASRAPSVEIAALRVSPARRRDGEKLLTKATVQYLDTKLVISVQLYALFDATRMQQGQGERERENEGIQAHSL